MKHYTPCFSIKLLVLEECDNTWCYTPVWPNMDSRRVTPPKKCKRLNHVSSRVCTVSLFTTGQKNIILEGFPKSTTRFKSRNSSRGLSPALCSLRSFSVTFQVDINNPVQFTPFFLVVRGFHKGEKPFFNAGWRSNCQEPLWRMTILRIGLMASIDVIFANRFPRLSSLRSVSNKETCTQKTNLHFCKKKQSTTVYEYVNVVSSNPAQAFWKILKSLNIKTTNFLDFF